MKDYLPGTEIIPGWEVVRLIGGGGFGKVYEAKKPDSGVGGDYRSAIKVIPIPHSDEDVEAYRENGYDEESITTIFRNQVEDFSAEFALMSQFKGTANIVSYEDHLVIQHDDGIGWDVFIRMELLTSLPARLKEAGMTEREVVSLGIDICTALDLCSRMHILHRDIKPQNVFLNKFGSFKLGDFGIARMQDHKTRSSVTGTPDYMAPEVYLNKPYDDKIDQYSLGLMMYWLLNERRLPFLPLPPAIETARERDEAFSRRIDGEPIPAPKNGSDALKAIVLKACNADPEKRFSSPAAMKNALLALGEVPEKTVLVPIGKNGPSASVKERKPETGSETIGAFSSFRPTADVKTERVEEEDRGQETIGAFSSVRPTADVKTERFDEEDRGQETIGAFSSVRPTADAKTERVEEEDRGQETIGAFSSFRPAENVKTERVEEEDRGQETIGAFSSFQPTADVKTERVEEEDRGQETIGAFTPVIPVRDPERKESVPKPDPIPVPEPAESGNRPVQPAPPMPEKKPEAAPEKKPDPVSRKGNGAAEPAVTGEKKKKNLLIPALIGAAVVVGIVLLLLLSRGCGKDEPPAERTVSGISIVSVPAKADYYVGEATDLTGLTLNVRYDDGSEETAASGFSYEPTELADVGTQKITVTYEGKTVTFNVVVRTAELKEIQILSLPSKTEYFVGETVDPSGLTLKTIFENGESSTVGEGFSLEGAELTEAGTKTVTVVFGGKTTTFEVKVSEKPDEEVTVTEITVKTAPTKTDYFVGDTLDVAGLSLTVKKSDGTEETVTDGFTCDPTAFERAGKQTVTVTCEGKTATFDVTITEDAITSVTLKSQPSRTDYFIGESLVSEGLSLNVTYGSGKTETVTEGFTVSPAAFNTAGTQTVTVAYVGKAVTFTVNVSNISVTSVALKSKPTKLAYFTGDTLNTAGLALTVTMSNGTSETVTSGFDCTPKTLNTAGTQTVTVTYGGKTASFPVTVTAVSVISVSVKAKPNKTSYYVGDTLNTAGLSMTVTKSNGTSETVTNGFTCSPTTMNTVGTQTITVSYKGKTATFTVNVTAASVTSVAIKTKPDKVEYFTGETIDPTGLSLTVTYSNGKTETVTSGYTLSTTDTGNFDASIPVTVTYGGKSASFYVLAKTVHVISLSVKTLPTKIQYYVGDTLDTTGMTLTAIYNNGKTITDWFYDECYPTTLDTVGTQKITVYRDGVMTTFTVEVVEKGVRIGDTVTFGRYEQDNNLPNGKEDIEWIVLDIVDYEGMKYGLLLSKYCLDCRAYDRTTAYVTWETSEMRAWLNGTFYQNAFTSAEKGRFGNNRSPANDNPTYHTDAGNTVDDLVFVFDHEEVYQYLPSKADRVCYATEYAKANGGTSMYDTADWWLRTPGFDQSCALVSDATGVIEDFGVMIDLSSPICVRPALWARLDD